MSLFLEEEAGPELPFDVKEAALTVIEAALELEACPYEAEVSLLLTDNDQIREMNRDCRGIDRATDVLSFPMVEYQAPADFSVLEKEMQDVFHPDSGELLLGDIVISKEKVFSQAEEYGHSLLREYSFLIAHSMLHLFGYDHIQEEDRLLMEEHQRKIMEEIHILR